MKSHPTGVQEMGAGGPGVVSRRQFSRAFTLGALALARDGVRSAEPPPPLRLGLCGGLDTAEKARKAGSDFLEASVQELLVPDRPDAVFAARLDLLKKSPLSVPACNSFIRRRDLFCVGPKANHGEVLQHVGVTFARAERAGVTTLVFGSAKTRQIPDGWDRARALEQFAGILKQMGTLAANHGVVVAVEPLCALECNFINRIGEVVSLVEAVGHPSVKGVADLYHMILGGDTPDDLKRALPCVHHVHLADPDRKRALPTPEGRNFRPFFQVLKEADYAGRISFEGSWNDQTLAGAFEETRQQWREA